MTSSYEMKDINTKSCNPMARVKVGALFEVHKYTMYGIRLFL